MKWTLSSPLVACLWLGLSACSFVLDTSTSQCSSDADCEARGPEFVRSVCQDAVCIPDPTWSCLKDRKPSIDDSKRFTVKLPLMDLASKGPVAGVNADVCYRLDVSCSNPIARGLVSNEAGIVTFSASAGFDGYVNIYGANETPALVFIDPPIASDRTLKPAVLVPAAAVPVFAAQFGVPLNPERGLVEFTTFDCQGRPAAGVSISVREADAQTTTVYLVNGILDRQATETSSDGFIGIANVPVGVVTVTLKEASTNMPLGSFGLIVRTGVMTISTLDPHAAN